MHIVHIHVHDLHRYMYMYMFIRLRYCFADFELSQLSCLGSSVDRCCICMYIHMSSVTCMYMYTIHVHVQSLLHVLNFYLPSLRPSLLLSRSSSWLAVGSYVLTHPMLVETHQRSSNSSVFAAVSSRKKKGLFFLRCVRV